VSGSAQLGLHERRPGPPRVDVALSRVRDQDRDRKDTPPWGPGFVRVTAVPTLPPRTMIIALRGDRTCRIRTLAPLRFQAQAAIRISRRVRGRVRDGRTRCQSARRIVRSVKTVLCYGDSNTWGCIPLTGPEPSRRFAPNERWPGVLREHLGAEYWVVEEGLNGRTTVWEDGLQPHRNGRELLLPALLSHRPVDIAILMLGTNDLKRRIGVSAAEIAEGAGMLVEIARGSCCGLDGAEPEVLLVCPPPLGRLPQFAHAFEGGAEKSRELAAAFTEVARERGCALLHAGTHISTSDVDGVHLDRDAHAALGAAVAEAVRNLEGNG